MIAKIIPRSPKSNLTVRNQIIPSRSNEKIKPGMVTKPQLNTVSTASPIKLLPSTRQETKVKPSTAKTRKPPPEEVDPFTNSLMANATNRAATMPPSQKERFLALKLSMKISS